MSTSLNSKKGVLAVYRLRVLSELREVLYGIVNLSAQMHINS